MGTMRRQLHLWHYEGIGSGLQFGGAPLLHLSGRLGQPTEEGPQLLLNL